ncbi:MAG TPA: RNA 2',3'-cyclic phosphodiesterase [Thermoleophilaceae bacterium]|nr:RNA 2',3'-cyclic phosphodiesterase [Thermoleophilaceae bacterium]
MTEPPVRARGSAAPRGPRARMFVALDLPSEARSALAAWRDELVDGRRDLRPVRAEALHVTLVFLGWQAEKEADAIASAAFEACSGLPAARLAAAGVRPLPPRDPRLFALDLEDEDGRAGAVQAAISDALEAGRWYRPERRPFWPHLTLARVKRGERRVAPLPGAPPPPAQAFEADAVTLYRSTLRPQGAVYDALAQATL